MRKFSYTIMFITVYFATLLLKNAETFHHTSANQGLIKMCPPGGPAFATAWQLSCGMRKKRSTTSSSPSCTVMYETYKKTILDLPKRVKRKAGYRPLSLTEMMQYCCHFGCTFRDLFPYCDPFGRWDS
ncbi:unnamed protein product [Dracunculus medinensis]|uniref:IlGF domain-containing protein n=1 Tax=Dracunculus medinensis TaxID=318479 RepID=A0A0N4U4A6_DRAME|nr:unnamed protein product [Dracunculus medinensis]